MAETIITKTCRICKRNKSTTEFYKRPNSIDGLRNDCIACRIISTELWSKTEIGRASQLLAKRRYNKTEKAKKARKRYNQSERGREVAKKQIERWRKENGDKVQAIHAVNHAVAAGELKPATNNSCCHCGKQAKEYHHHMGYNRENWLDVIPVCKLCHVHLHISKK